MAFKSGSPTNYRQNISGPRRGQRGVGETYQERRRYETTVKGDEAKNSFFGRVKDFFLGSKLPGMEGFASNASYISGRMTVREKYRSMEQGSSTAVRSSDRELLSILSEVNKK